MTLKELKMLAEAANENPLLDWRYDIGIDSAELNRIAVVCGKRVAEFIKIMSPAAILKLLEMIAVLREGYGYPLRRTTANAACAHADEIARSL